MPLSKTILFVFCTFSFLSFASANTCFEIPAHSKELSKLKILKMTNFSDCSKDELSQAKELAEEAVAQAYENRGLYWSRNFSKFVEATAEIGAYKASLALILQELQQRGD